MTLKRTGFLPRKQQAFVRTDRKEAGAVAKVRMKHGKVAPNAEESAWMAAVASHGCIVCRLQGRGLVPCAVHHIVEGQRRVGHLFTYGLCDPGHHQNSPDAAQISRHPWKARFETAYGTEYELLEITRQIIKGESAADCESSALSIKQSTENDLSNEMIALQDEALS